MERSPRLVNRVARLGSILLKPCRLRIQGTENLPDQPCILIANHNVGTVVDFFALLILWVSRYGTTRAASALAHRALFRTPVLRGFFQRLGAVPATHEAARLTLRTGASLLIFPGGNRQLCRPVWKAHENTFDGHQGWARIAKEASVPVIPIAITGTHLMNPIFLRSRLLSRLLLIRWVFGASWFPVSLAQILAVSTFLLVAPASWPWVLKGFIAWNLSIWTIFLPLFPFPVRITVLPSINPVHLSVDEIYSRGERAIDDQLRRDVRKPDTSSHSPPFVPS